MSLKKDPLFTHQDSALHNDIWSKKKLDFQRWRIIFSFCFCFSRYIRFCIFNSATQHMQQLLSNPTLRPTQVFDRNMQCHLNPQFHNQIQTFSELFFIPQFCIIYVRFKSLLLFIQIVVSCSIFPAFLFFLPQHIYSW